MEQEDPTLTKESLLAAKQWLEEQKENIPKDVIFCLVMLIDNMLKGEGSVKSAAKGFHELLVKFGFKPSSEKQKSNHGTKTQSGKEKCAQLARQCKSLLSKHTRMTQELEDSMKQNLTIQCDERDDRSINEINLILEQPEDLQDEITEQKMESTLNLGSGADVSLSKSGELLFPATATITESKNVSFNLEKAKLEAVFGKNVKGLVRETITTTRYDFTLQTACIKTSYETARDPNSGKSMSAAPENMGPKGSQITYRALVNLMVLAIGFLMPTHRISRLLGGISIFNRTNILRYMGFSAEKLLPVYLELGKQLANAKYMAADATPTRVNEVNQAIEKRNFWFKNQLIGPPEPLPWELQTPEEEEDESLMEQKTPLWKRLEKELGFVFDSKRKKIGSNVPKMRHQTMVIHGKADLNDPNSHIFFFRSALGDVGNVLDKLLQKRSIQANELYLQCDHSSANHVSDPDILKRIDIKIAGCLAHSRRKFKKHESQDPETVNQILTMMFQLSYIEQRLDEVGRNRENVRAMRRSWGAQALELIYFAVKKALLSPNWSDQTPLGKAGLHFIKHFKKLTLYLSHPELDSTNNSCERALRPEKLAQGSSYFRDTLEGRARFDILRTIYQTCAAIDLSFSHYLLHIFLQPKLDIERHPQNFTPQAVKKALAESENLSKKLNKILLYGY